MEIRLAQRGDEPAIVAAIRTLHDRAAEWGAASEFLEDPSCVMLLAFEGSDPVACLYGYELRRPHTVQSQMFLYRIDVLASYRRQGIGKALIERFLEEGRKRGASKCWVQAGSTDPDAQAFYRACGGVEYPDKDVLFGFTI